MDGFGMFSCGGATTGILGPVSLLETANGMGTVTRFCVLFVSRIILNFSCAFLKSGIVLLIWGENVQSFMISLSNIAFLVLDLSSADGLGGDGMGGLSVSGVCARTSIDVFFVFTKTASSIFFFSIFALINSSRFWFACVPDTKFIS